LAKRTYKSIRLPTSSEEQATMVSACRHAVKRCLVKSPKVAEITSTSLAGWTGAAAVSLFLAYKVVDDEPSSRPTTLLQGSGNFSSMNARYFASEPGTVEQMEEIVSEYLSTDGLGIGSFLQSMLDKIQTTRQDSNENVVTDMESIGENERVPVPAAAKFPSLAAQIVNDDNKSAQYFPINSSSSFPIENDLFVGNIKLVLRPLTPEDDPHFKDRVLDAQKTTFEIQIQGKFKRIPRGKMYMGGQITEPSLGGMTKGISNLLLRLLSRHVGANLAYSFGTDDELPHISFPLMTCMENVVITKPHERIPSLGQPFVESHESRQRRRSSAEDVKKWNLEDTYSMSYSADSIDLSAWRIVYPCEVTLGNLWGNSALRLIVYEKDQQTDKSHNLVALQLKFLGIPSSSSVRGEESEVEPSPILARA
jgi:hypothetical protein